MIDKDAKLIRALLWLPVKLYEMVVCLRLFVYQKGYLKSGRLDAFVISVGNITVGGTGKTPMVGFIGHYLLREGHRVAVLTRGYKRKSAGRRVLNDPRHPGEKNYLEYGDEPLLLARLLPQAPVVIDKERYESGLWTRKEFGTDVLLLDDGYQHLKVHRDLNILLLDATDPFGSFAIAPLGRLREPLEALERADVVLITRANHAIDKQQMLQIIAFHCRPSTPLFSFSSAIIHFKDLLTGQIVEVKELIEKKAAVMCGIGNPRAFVDDLRQIGLQITSENFFADHYDYTQKDIENVQQAAQNTGAEIILTTEKDAVRLDNLKIAGMPIYAAVLEMRSDNEDEFLYLLSQSLSKKKAPGFDVKSGSYED